jgi:hypothetical protein
MARARARDSRWVPVLVAAGLALLSAAGLARAERRQQGDVILALDGGVFPSRLPRHDPAPVRIRLFGELRTADRFPLPRVRRLELTLFGRGRLDAGGLPVCPRGKLVAADPATALAACGAALVGSGRVDAQVFLPNQRPFSYGASLRAFNGMLPGGRRVVWLHAYGSSPPISFVFAFAIHRLAGRTSLVAALPADLGPWPHLARFRMSFGRLYRRRGERHSYLSAVCPLPPRFTAGVFPFARATYSFAGGGGIGVEIVRGCRVRGDRR